MTKKIQLPTQFDEYGEAILPEAPNVELGNGKRCIPQQFFHYQRTVANVEHILSKVEFCRNYPLFVFEENGHVFLQVGIVGHENYPPTDDFSKRNDKIVYGRKWFIDPYTPTSEVIQTAFLAINKVREHELREQLTLHFDYKGKHCKATPFNTHIDLPLAAQNQSLFYPDETDMNPLNFKSAIKKRLTAWTLGKFSLRLSEAMMVDRPHWLVGVELVSHHDNEQEYQQDIIVRYFPELTKETVYFVTNQHEMTSFFYELMNGYIGKAESFVANHFSYDGFKRFAHALDPLDFAKFSVDTRLIKTARSEQFKQLFEKMAAVVDGSRAPRMAKCVALRNQQQQALSERKNLEGYLPAGQLLDK